MNILQLVLDLWAASQRAILCVEQRKGPGLPLPAQLPPALASSMISPAWVAACTGLAPCAVQLSSGKPAGIL